MIFLNLIVAKKIFFGKLGFQPGCASLLRTNAKDECLSSLHGAPSSVGNLSTQVLETLFGHDHLTENRTDLIEIKWPHENYLFWEHY